MDFLYSDCTQNHTLKTTIPTGSISNNKKDSVPRGDFSNYFMKIIVLSQLYCLNSVTIEITYDIKK